MVFSENDGYRKPFVGVQEKHPLIVLTGPIENSLFSPIGKA